MDGDGVSDISAGAHEGVGGMVNGTGLTSESIVRLGVIRGGSTEGAETCVDNELAKVRGFLEGDNRGGLVRSVFLHSGKAGKVRGKISVKEKESLKKLGK